MTDNEVRQFWEVGAITIDTPLTEAQRRAYNQELRKRFRPERAHIVPT